MSDGKPPEVLGDDGGDRPGGEDYAARVSPFVERFAADLTESGMQRTAARVFACLLASEGGALTSAELADRLRVSPAAVSGAVRYLSQVRMVSRERAPGSRRELYRVHEDIWYEVSTNRDRLLDRWVSTLSAGAETLGTDTPAGRRLRGTAEFFAFLQKELADVLPRWRELRASQDTD